MMHLEPTFTRRYRNRSNSRSGINQYLSSLFWYVQPFSQLFARTKRNHLSLGDGHRLAGFRITSPARRFITDIQAAKLDQFDRFSINQGVFQGRKNGIDNFSCVSLGNTQLSSDRYGQFFSCYVIFFHFQYNGWSWLTGAILTLNDS